MEIWSPDQLKAKLEEEHKVFLKLFKKGCGSCRMSETATNKIEEKNKHGMLFAKISVDDYPEMLEVSGTDVLPAFFVFADKKKQGQFIGFKGQKKLEDFIDSSLEGGSHD